MAQAEHAGRVARARRPPPPAPAPAHAQAITCTCPAYHFALARSGGPTMTSCKVRSRRAVRCGAAARMPLTSPPPALTRPTACVQHIQQVVGAEAEHERLAANAAQVAGGYVAVPLRRPAPGAPILTIATAGSADVLPAASSASSQGAAAATTAKRKTKAATKHTKTKAKSAKAATSVKREGVETTARGKKAPSRLTTPAVPVKSAARPRAQRAR